jgi:hypothetical protein
MKLTWRGPGACTIAAIGVVVWLISQASAAPLNIQTESYRIPAADSGVELYIRNKHPARVSNFPAEKILLFVHGATYPAETAFDLPLNGLSLHRAARMGRLPCRREGLWRFNAAA